MAKPETLRFYGIYNDTALGPVLRMSSPGSGRVRSITLSLVQLACIVEQASSILSAALVEAEAAKTRAPKHPPVEPGALDAEISTVRRLLASIPEDMVIDRASLQGRIDSLTEEKGAGRG